MDNVLRTALSNIMRLPLLISVNHAIQYVNFVQVLHKINVHNVLLIIIYTNIVVSQFVPSSIIQIKQLKCVISVIIDV